MLTPWKKSYDQPRQHIKKQRYYFAYKSPYSQSYGFSRSHVWTWELDQLWCWRRLLRVPRTARRSNQSILSRKSVLDIHWKNCCWSWNFNTLATWCEELTHWKRPWCWERLKLGGEGHERGWDGWMASLTRWTWVWTSSRVGDGQGSLACCTCKVRVTKSGTWLSDWTKLNQSHWRNSVHILKEGRICHLKIDPIIRVIVGWLFLRSCRHRKNSET